MNDNLLRELVKKLNDRLKNNDFLLIYIEKMLWHFGNKELFTKENKIIGVDKYNNIFFIDMTDEEKTIISLSKSNCENVIEVKNDKVNIQRNSIDIEKLRNNITCKDFLCEKVHFDDLGNLVGSDSWYSTITQDSTKKTEMNKKEQITIYENDNIYSYVKANGTIYTNTIEKNQININDYVKCIDDNNLFSIINLIFNDISSLNIKFNSIADEKLVSEKVKKRSFR